MKVFIIFFQIFILHFLLFDNLGYLSNSNNYCLDKYKDSLLNQSDVIDIDLDKYKPNEIQYNPFKEHKIFDRINEIDTLDITKNIKSILKSYIYIPAKTDYDVDLILSSVFILKNDKLIFRKDSVLSTGIYEFVEKDSILSIPLINKQSPDNFNSKTDLYLIFLRKNETRCVQKSLTNTANAFFSLKSNNLFYLDNNNLFKYDYISNTKKLSVRFINDYFILGIKLISENSANVIFIKDIFDHKIFKVEIIFNKNLFF